MNLSEEISEEEEEISEEESEEINEEESEEISEEENGRPDVSPSDIKLLLSKLTPLTSIIGKSMSSPPPPIPSPLVKPEPLKLVIQRPIPAVTIQPAVPEKTISLIIEGKEKVSVLEPIKIITKPIKIISKPIVTTEEATIDTMLVKRKTETVDMFKMRSVYSKIAIRVFQNKINPATAILLGEMAANKAVYGITYPEESDEVIRYINAQIERTL